MTAAIRTQELTKRFRSVHALDRVTLEVQQGAIYALVGPNGAGKTTGIKILMNLLGATSGEAEVLGMDFSTSSIPAGIASWRMPWSNNLNCHLQEKSKRCHGA